MMYKQLYNKVSRYNILWQYRKYLYMKYRSHKDKPVIETYIDDIN